VDAADASHLAKEFRQVAEVENFAARVASRLELLIVAERRTAVDYSLQHVMHRCEIWRDHGGISDVSDVRSAVVDRAVAGNTICGESSDGITIDFGLGQEVTFEDWLNLRPRCVLKDHVGAQRKNRRQQGKE